MNIMNMDRFLDELDFFQVQLFGNYVELMSICFQWIILGI